MIRTLYAARDGGGETWFSSSNLEVVSDSSRLAVVSVPVEIQVIAVSPSGMMWISVR